MASVGRQLANWCLHGMAWHESNASKHPRPLCFVPHRKLPSLHHIGWALHANTPTNPSMRMSADHAALDLIRPHCRHTSFIGCRSLTALQYARDIAGRGVCFSFGSCRLANAAPCLRSCLVTDSWDSPLSYKDVSSPLSWSSHLHRCAQTIAVLFAFFAEHLFHSALHHVPDSDITAGAAFACQLCSSPP